MVTSRIKLSTPGGHVVVLFGIISITLIAQAADRLIVSPDYESLISDGVYEDSQNWRQPNDDELGWRQQQQQKESRIKFGYDPTYDEMRARKSQESSSSSFGYEQTKPSSLFRLEF